MVSEVVRCGSGRGRWRGVVRRGQRRGGGELGVRGRASAVAAMDVTLVHVDVASGGDEKFVAASGANAASSSTTEPDCRRFDLMRGEAEGEYLLVEVYDNEEAVKAHKTTKHYLDWRSDVADIMASPRRGIKYKVIAPPPSSDAWGRSKGGSSPTSITHVYVDCVPECVDEFAAAASKNAAASAKEPENVRFEVLQSVDDTSKFVLIEEYETADGAVAHKSTPHYLEWRETVAPMMKTPRTAKKYTLL